MIAMSLTLASALSNQHVHTTHTEAMLLIRFRTQGLWPSITSAGCMCVCVVGGLGVSKINGFPIYLNST